MIEERPDWVLSRQRAWGVPIAVFADADGNVLKDEAVNRRILEAFEDEGADAWFAPGAKARFLGNQRPVAAGTRSMDILDVWFDSRLDPCLHAWRTGPTSNGRPTSISKAPTSIAAGSTPRCWRAAARAAARPTTRSSPMASPWTRTAARCRSRSATPSRRRTSSSSPAPTSCASGWRRPTTGRTSGSARPSCRPTSTPIASCATPCAGCSARSPMTTATRWRLPRCPSSSG